MKIWWFFVTLLFIMLFQLFGRPVKADVGEVTYDGDARLLLTKVPDELFVPIDQEVSFFTVGMSSAGLGPVTTFTQDRPTVTDLAEQSLKDGFVQPTKRQSLRFTRLGTYRVETSGQFNQRAFRFVQIVHVIARLPDRRFKFVLRDPTMLFATGYVPYLIDDLGRYYLTQTHFEVITGVNAQVRSFDGYLDATAFRDGVLQPTHVRMQTQDGIVATQTVWGWDVTQLDATTYQLTLQIPTPVRDFAPMFSITTNAQVGQPRQAITLSVDPKHDIFFYGRTRWQIEAGYSPWLTTPSLWTSQLPALYSWSIADKNEWQMPMIGQRVTLSVAEQKNLTLSLKTLHQQHWQMPIDLDPLEIVAQGPWQLQLSLMSEHGLPVAFSSNQFGDALLGASQPPIVITGVDTQKVSFDDVIAHVQPAITTGQFAFQLRYQLLFGPPMVAAQAQ